MLEYVAIAAVVYCDFCTRCTNTNCEKSNLFYGVA